MRTKRRMLAVVASAGLLFAAAGPAALHVTVSSTDAAPGGYGKLVFRVPSESETASTTKVQVAGGHAVRECFAQATSGLAGR